MSAEGSLAGKICLVTGTTSGIGKATALGLARLGATVVLVGRDKSRGEATRNEIANATDNQKLDLLLADLSRQDSIRQLANDFQAKYDQLHILINNAGLSQTRRNLTPDGLETTFAVNHLAYFLLTNLLLDTIKRSAPARIINVSSQAHSGGHINFDDLQMAQNYSEFRAYSQSKLANVLFTKELARRLSGTGVTTNCLHPGLVRTNFAGDSKGFFSLMLKLSRPLQISPEKGAETSLYLATAPEVANISGEYFDKKKPAKVNAEANDPAIARRLWEVSAQLTGLATSSVGQNS